ncbi:pyroglutamyl-peptidase 1-like, partial [Boleophthalmus pectinirostris]|uniref:pyroglutamyl-peptidase 1-like n=1 Tax=Boleophthalmus pectinirostris TaxID=150288 RepID=UPI00242E0998
SGFGPFGEHTVNASWVAVQELKKLGLGSGVDLHVYEVPVEYHTVQTLVPALWEQYHPLSRPSMSMSMSSMSMAAEEEEARSRFIIGFLRLRELGVDL